LNINQGTLISSWIHVLVCLFQIAYV
jgi:hypothetical protein